VEGKCQPLIRRKQEFALSDWRKYARLTDGLHIRVGRWRIPGQPIAVLVDFHALLCAKNEIYAWAWRNIKFDSLHAYGDYDEASMFSWAAGTRGRELLTASMA
jgi:hypothetical protein